MLSRLARLLHTTPSVVRRAGKRCSSSHTRPGIETDSCGIPVRPTWSVDELLSSYPSPTISPDTLKHLHSLSALVPPEKGTQEHAQLKGELEDLVKLVEAVKLVNVEESRAGYRDGRMCTLDEENLDVEAVTGRTLLRHAAHTSDEFYVVDTKRVR